MREYKYFVSFYQRVPARDTINNSIITTGKKIDSLEDIFDIEKVIRKKLIEFGESEKNNCKTYKYDIIIKK